MFVGVVWWFWMFLVNGRKILNYNMILVVFKWIGVGFSDILYIVVVFIYNLGFYFVIFYLGVVIVYFEFYLWIRVGDLFWINILKWNFCFNKGFVIYFVLVWKRCRILFLYILLRCEKIMLVFIFFILESN